MRQKIDKYRKKQYELKSWRPIAVILYSAVKPGNVIMQDIVARYINMLLPHFHFSIADVQSRLTSGGALIRPMQRA